MTNTPEDKGKVKSKRASRPKVKTGCNNCKQRRVKCDETRPQCNKCVKSGRRCEGYPAYKRASDIAIPIAPRPGSIAIASSSTTHIAPSTVAKASSNLLTPPSTKSVVVRQPPERIVQKPRPTPPPTPGAKFSPTTYAPGRLTFDVQEGQYFQVFRTHTANELSGFFDSEFWTRSVLQESHSEASIRHAVVALGALYKTLEKVAESPPSSPDSSTERDAAPNHYNFALQQYGKSLARLRESLEFNEMRSRRTILISIVLYTCFQSFTGDHKAAITQIQHGLGLLEERRQEAKQRIQPKRGDEVEDELVQMFTRLATQAKSYDMAFHFPHPYVIRLSPQRNPSSPQSPQSPSEESSNAFESQIPDVFTTSQEARSSLDYLCERMMRFQENLSSYYQGPNNILPASIKSFGLGFRTQLAKWADAFEPLLQSRRRPGISNTERAGINVLKMLQTMTTILFMMGFSTSEMDFDNFFPQMQEIIELAKEVVVDEELTLALARCGDTSDCRHRHRSANGWRSNPTANFPGLAAHPHGAQHDEDGYDHIKASFALDLGIVPPLFVVATKCRDRRLRRDAIKLLMASPRREGMWDSILSGRAGQWIMEIEEEGMGEYLGYGMGSMDGAVVEQDKRIMIKAILFDLQKREATLRCGTRGARDGDDDPRAREAQISW